MALMCEICKCTIGNNSGCDNNCQCCNGESLAEGIAKRTAQVIKASSIDREAMDEADENDPIIQTETAPNRFNILTYFFPEEDGVRIEEDLDLNLITIHYFNDEGDIELTEGALYDWALALYEEDNR